MKRKIVTLLLTGLLSVSMTAPGIAFAGNPVNGEGQKAFSATGEAVAYAKMKAMDADPENENHGHEEEVAATFSDPAYVPTGAYGKQNLTELNTDKKLIFKDLPSLKAKNDEEGEGLLLKDSGEEFASGRIALREEFRFDGNAVGRITVDGLAERGTKASVEVYLDDADQPVATLKLGRQRKKGKWTGDGEQTQDVLEQNIKGKHRVSLRIVTDTKEDTSVLLRSLEFAQSSLPVVYINIDEEDGTIAEMNNDSEHKTECYGTLNVQTPAGYTNEYNGKTTKKVENTGDLQMEYIRGRGNSTWTEKKKPYKIKLDKKADLLGMGKNKHWVLLANAFDNSKMRNKMTYWLGDQLGLPYTPQCQFVEVVMNGKYLGGYYLCEHVRVGESRVEVDDLSDEKNPLDADTITGGYLLSLGYYGDDPDKEGFQTKDGIGFLIESPQKGDWKNKTSFADVKNYISGYVQDTEDAIYSDSHKNAKGQTYSDLLDTDSAVRYHWVQEFSANGDAYGSNSTYLYKKRGGKLYFGPLWDFDYVAWGDTDYPDADEGQSADSSTQGWTQNNSMWFGKLLSDPAFFNKMKAEWPVLKGKLQEITKDGGLLDQYYDQMAVSQKYDYEKWGHMDFSSGKPLTFKQEENRLRDWINARSVWTDKNLDTMAPKTYRLTFKLDGKTVKKVDLAEEEQLKTLPEAPKKRGYIFAGWYVRDGKKSVRISAGYQADKSRIVYGRYVKKKDAVPVKNIYFRQKADTTWYYGEDDSNTYQMNAETMPENATDITLNWTSSDKTVAEVDENGTVSIKKPGIVTITAKARRGKAKSSYKLYIEDTRNGDDIQQSSGFSLNRKKITVNAGGYDAITPSFSPEKSYAPEFYYASGNEKIATVSQNGVVTGHKAGKTVIVFFAPYIENGLKIIPVTVKAAGEKKIP